MLLNCGAGKDSCESLDCKEIQPVHPKGDQSWVFIGKTDFEAETPLLWPPDAKSWLIWKDSCWERLRAGGEGDDRGWDGWMASPTQWTWVWVDSGSWWWTGRPGVLWFMGSQSRTQLSDWTELNWTDLIPPFCLSAYLFLCSPFPLTVWMINESLLLHPKTEWRKKQGWESPFLNHYNTYFRYFSRQTEVPCALQIYFIFSINFFPFGHTVRRVWS